MVTQMRADLFFVHFQILSSFLPLRSRLFVFTHLDKGIHQTTAQHGKYTHHTHDCSLISPNVKGHHGLDRSLGGSRNIMRKGTGGLDLQDSHDTNTETEKPGNTHGTPKDSV